MTSLALTLNKRVVIKQRGDVQDAYGGMIPGWTTLATVWASVADMSGREYVAASATQNAVQTKITIRQMSGIAPSMRVVHGSIIYNIEAVLGQNNRTLVLMCTRGEINE